jgi:hypothetical protein
MSCWRRRLPVALLTCRNAMRSAVEHAACSAILDPLAALVPAQRRAATAKTPRRPIGAGGGEESSRSGSLSVITTHALFALKVQRKVSNGVAGLAAAGSSLDRQKSWQFLPSQRSTNARASIPAYILALGPSCVSHVPQLKRE